MRVLCTVAIVSMRTYVLDFRRHAIDLEAASTLEAVDTEHDRQQHMDFALALGATARIV